MPHPPCSRCGKVNEITALSRGICNVVLDTDFDVVLSGEDWLCVSSQFVEVYKQLGALGLQFTSLPNEFFLVFCNNLLPVDPDLAGFQELNECKVCGRFQERIVGPMAVSFGQVPNQESFFTASIPNENVRAMHQRIFTSERMANLFRHSSLRGMCFVEW